MLTRRRARADRAGGGVGRAVPKACGSVVLCAAIAVSTGSPAPALAQAVAAPAPAGAVPAGSGVLATAVRATPSRDARRWALDAVNAPAAWQISKGSGVTVAVLGTGRPDDAVPELRGRVEQGPDMTGMTGAGLMERDPDLTGALPDRPGRGATAAASLIAGSGRGGGISGVAPEARVLAIPVVERGPEQSPDDGFIDPGPDLFGDSPLARGIRHAVNRGASVICIPVAHYGVSRVEREAVSYALSRGAVLVAPVGDDGRSDHALRNGTSYWRFPAGYPGVVGVAAVDRHGRRTADSSDNLSVLVAAPGADVPVALPGGGHGTASGTAVAGAIVAGVVALIKAKYPDIPPELVSRALTSTARSRPRAGYDDKVGFGVVDAAAALRKAGELLGYGQAAPVRDDAYFGGGPLTGAPTRPGPDPVRLWAYGIAVLLGAAGFGVAVGALARKRTRPL